MKILLVDDDADLLAVTAFALQQAGMLVVTADSFGTAMAVFRAEQPDLAILDINLPGGSGFELCQAMRRESPLPILMLTVRSEEADLVRALDMSADDYLTKPYSPRTLIARVRALLRRTGASTGIGMGADAAGATGTLGSAGTPGASAGAFQLDPTALELRADGRVHRVTPLEARLLQLLIAHAGKSVPAERLLTHVWGQRGGGDRQLLKQLVHRLRHKLAVGGVAAAQIETVPNVGYRLTRLRKGTDGAPPGAML